MCVAVPGRVVSIDTPRGRSRMARVTLGAVERVVDLAMVPEAVVGDYVVVHSGFAVSVLPEQVARETLQLLEADPLGGVGD